MVALIHILVPKIEYSIISVVHKTVIALQTSPVGRMG
jgi:hypothetical protein